jgi:cell division septation protein DedD
MVLILSLSLVIACSQKQDEADRIEQEMLAAEQDSVAAADSAAAAAAATPPADVAAVPAEETSPYATTTDEGEGFAIQIASCESVEYAEHLVGLYAGRGYEPYITEYDLNGQLYYRVRLGGMATLADAKAVKDDLVDRYSVKCWIDRL